MSHDHKPAALGDAAGSLENAFSWRTTRSEYGRAMASEQGQLLQTARDLTALRSRLERLL